MKKRVFRRWGDDPASLRDLLAARLALSQDVAIVDKPPGLPSQEEPGQRSYCLAVGVARDLGDGARLMHRLDKDASGLVVVALRKSAYGPLQRAMAGTAIERRYLAVARGSLSGDGAIKKRIG